MPGPTRPITVTVPHSLGREEAKRRLQAGMGEVRARLSAVATVQEEQWVGDALTFTILAMGQTLTGRIDVLEEQAVVEVRLPWMLALMADRIRSLVHRHGPALLSDGRKPPDGPRN